MKRGLSLLLSLGYCTLGQGLFLSAATAQVTPDGTTNTTVDVNGNDFTIEQGDRAGGNLFHSFGDFSVPNGGSAFFNNGVDIVNIFSRVTGGNISNIDGLLRANGAANLFLINPAGIIFGRNARLDIGGSFFGSTADSFVFEDGEFSTTDLDNPPVLTINAPIGLNFRENPGDIVNTSIGQNPNGETNVTGGAVGLQVPAGETLAIVGGDVLLDDGNLTAKGGHIEIGSVRGGGEVGITETNTGFILDYDSITSFGDITLQNTAVVDVTAGNGGSINVNGGNIVLDNSSLFSGIALGLGSSDAQAGDININAISLNVTNIGQIIATTLGLGNSGDININASGIVTLDSGQIFNFVGNESIGNSGNINIEASSLNVTNTGQINATTLGQGDTGSVNILAEETVSFDGRDETDTFPSAIFVDVREGAIGNAGDINITTSSLQITNRAQLVSNTQGMGDAGNIYIDARDEVSLSNSILISEVTEGTGIGDGGDITIKTGSLLLQNGSALLADTENVGNAGDIIIEASERVILEGQGPEAQSGSLEDNFIVPSQITATVDDFEGAVGNGGNISISTPSLSIKDDGFIRVSTLSLGQGDAGNLLINTGKLLVENGGQISATTFSEGNAGNLTVTASESIELVGSDGEFPSGLFASAIEGTGNAGNLTIATDKLIVRDEAVVSVGNFQQVVEGGPEPRLPGSGDAGTLNINANSIEVDNGTITAANASGIGGELAVNTTSLTLDNEASISANTTANTGTGGNIDLNVGGTIQMRDNSLISAQATEGATGGNIDINTEFIVAFPNQNNDITANASQGNGGNINITAESLFGIEERSSNPPNDTNDIDASSEFGLDGSVSIVTPDINPIQTDIQLPNNPIEAGQTFAQACQGDRFAGKTGGLTVKGKGGTPSTPTDPFDSETILVDESTTNSNPQANYPEIKPIATSIGEIYPARGIIKTEEGKIILTAYATDNLNTRTPHNSANCNH